MRELRIPDAKALSRFAASREAMAAFCVLLAFYFVYHATKFHLANVWPLRPIGDAGILVDTGKRVFDLADYPARLESWRRAGVFPYPPSAVLIFRWLAFAGPAAFMGLWLLAMAGGLVLSLRASLAGERSEIAVLWGLAAAMALVVTDGPVSWDLRNANSNLVCLGLIMGGYSLTKRLPWIAGALVGLSIAIKPYSGLLLLWMLVTGSWRALLAGLGTLLVLAVLWPLATWGPAGFLQVYLGWLEQLRIIADPQVHAAIMAGASGAPVVSLDRAAMALTGEPPEATTVRALVVAMDAIWIAAVLWYVRQAAGSRELQVPSRAALADWTMLMLLPLPFSPWLEPYHAVPMLPGAVLLAVIAMDNRCAARDRWIAFAALAALLLTRALDFSWDLRGLLLLIRFLLIAVALGLLRPRLLGTRSPRPASSSSEKAGDAAASG